MITTTESLRGGSKLRCGRCSASLVAATIADGRPVGWCCAGPSDRLMLESMGAGEDSVERLRPTFLAADPLSGESGVTREAAWVLNGLRKRGVLQATDEEVEQLLSDEPDGPRPPRYSREPGLIAMGPGEDPAPGEPRPIMARARG